MIRVAAEYAPQGLLPWWTSHGMGLARLKPEETSTAYVPAMLDDEHVGWYVSA